MVQGFLLDHAALGCNLNIEVVLAHSQLDSALWYVPQEDNTDFAEKQY